MKLFVAALMLLFVSGCDEPENPIPQKGPEHFRFVNLSSTSGCTLREMRDDEHHVTCWIACMESISCLRDEPVAK